MKLPKTRTENIVEQNLGTETLIYDLTIHKAFNLNETLSIVYRACDGKTSFADLKRKYQLTDDFVYLALDELKRNDLLTDGADYHSPLANTSRREAIKKISLTTAAALPLIVGLTAPKSVNAQSAEPVCRAFQGCTCTVANSEENNEENPPTTCADLRGTDDCGGASGCPCLVFPGGNGGVCIPQA